MPIGTAATFGNPTFDLLHRGKLGDTHRYLYQGKSADVRGYHIPADSFSKDVSAVLVEKTDGFSLEAPEGQQHLSVKVRWDERSGQTHLVVSNSDTNPETGKGWGDGEVDTRPGHKEHRVETAVPLDWTEQDWGLVNDGKLQTFGFDRPDSQPGWHDGYETFKVIERPLIEGYNIASIGLRRPSQETDGIRAEGYIVEIGDPSDPDKYLIHHTVTHLSSDKPDLRAVKPGH